MIVPVYTIGAARLYRTSYEACLTIDRPGSIRPRRGFVGSSVRPLVRCELEVSLPSPFRRVARPSDAEAIGTALGATLLAAKDATVAIMIDDTSDARGIAVAIGRRDPRLEARGFARCAIVDDAVAALVLVVVRAPPHDRRPEPYDRVVLTMTRRACEVVGARVVDHLIVEGAPRRASAESSATTWS